MIIGIIGILKSSGAYLPIEPGYPQERIDYMLKDSGVKLLINEKFFGGLRVPRRGEPIMVFQKIPPGKANLAYIIYTSGSTGKPKGVMVEHGSIFNTIYWRKQEYNFGVSDRTLQLFSFAFDGFLTSFFTPIVSGASVVLLSKDEIKDMPRIKEIIKVLGITYFICVPALFRSLLEISAGEKLASLKIVTLGGDEVQPDLVVKSKQLNPLLEIINEYGPTESSVQTSIGRNIQAGTMITIGKPIANTIIYIIDNDENILPPGVPGQLVISGKGLARGYLNNPELTCEKFNRSYRSYKTYILYRTGDLARRLADGNIEFLGRIDQQVKIRGFRIELGEITGMLKTHPAIKDAVVIDRVERVDGGQGNRKYLCAYIVIGKTPGQETIQPQELHGLHGLHGLKEYLSKKLPDYMIPSSFVEIEKIPLNPNGKLNLKALPQSLESDFHANLYEAPRTDIQCIMVETWQEVLGREKVGIRDNFFDLGGNSLDIVKVANKLKEKLGREIPVVTFFTYPNISSLERYLTMDQENSQPETAVDHFELIDEAKDLLTNVLDQLDGEGD